LRSADDVPDQKGAPGTPLAETQASTIRIRIGTRNLQAHIDSASPEDQVVDSQRPGMVAALSRQVEFWEALDAILVSDSSIRVHALPLPSSHERIEDTT
jgi:hypothetical protein